MQEQPLCGYTRPYLLDRTASLSLESFKAILWLLEGTPGCSLIAVSRARGCAHKPTSECLHTPPSKKEITTCYGTTVRHFFCLKKFSAENIRKERFLEPPLPQFWNINRIKYGNRGILVWPTCACSITRRKTSKTARNTINNLDPNPVPDPNPTYKNFLRKNPTFLLFSCCCCCCCCCCCHFFSR